MPATRARPSASDSKRWLLAPLRWLRMGLWVVVEFLVVTWARLDLSYANLPWAWARIGLAVAFLLFIAPDFSALIRAGLPGMSPLLPESIK